MPRPHLPVRPIEVAFSLPSDLIAAVEIHLWDPINNRAKYGARSKLVAALLREWLRLRENSPTGREPLTNDEASASTEIDNAAKAIADLPIL